MKFAGAGYDLHTLSHADQDDLKEIFLSNERNHLVKFKIARSQWVSGLETKSILNGDAIVGCSN